MTENKLKYTAEHFINKGNIPKVIKLEDLLIEFINDKLNKLGSMKENLHICCLRIDLEEFMTKYILPDPIKLNEKILLNIAKYYKEYGYQVWYIGKGRHMITRNVVDNPDIYIFWTKFEDYSCFPTFDNLDSKNCTGLLEDTTIEILEE